VNDKFAAGGSRTAEDISSKMMEALGLRQEYSQLKTQSSSAKQSLQRLLEARDSVGSTLELSAHACCGVADLLKWQRGQFFPVADKHMTELRRLLESFKVLEDAARERLRDKEAFVVWHLRHIDNLAEMRSFLSGCPDFLPRRLLVESPELTCYGMDDEVSDEGLGTQAVFRLYPCGDSMACEESMTVYIWLEPAPSKNFAFDFVVGPYCRTSPRLWKVGQARHRLDVQWCDVQRSLEAIDHESACLDVKLQILQWFPAVNTDATAAFEAGSPSSWRSGPCSPSTHP